MKKTILVSIITSVLTVGAIFLIGKVFCGSCKAKTECSKGEYSCSKDKESCERKSKCGKKKSHCSKSEKKCKKGASKHGHGHNMMDMLKEERAAFDEKLTDEEKVILAELKTKLADLKEHGDNHAELKEKYATELAELKTIADAHKEELDAIHEAKMKEMMKHHGEGKENPHGEEKMKDHSEMFYNHFLLME